ncbi:MAG: 30S ribosomal protein S6 [Candidatus Cloacimonas sp.]
MTKDYELMLILTPALSLEEAKAMNDSLLSFVTDNGGEIIKIDPWGKRMLAYPIKKFREGYYFVDYFKLDSLLIKKWKALFNINENIIRHIFVAKD